jgi:hypothetical protein
MELDITFLHEGRIVVECGVLEYNFEAWSINVMQLLTADSPLCFASCFASFNQNSSNCLLVYAHFRSESLVLM